MLDFTGTRVVAIFAHPDDESFTVGGALMAFVDRGATVTLISATRGEEGEIAHPSLATPENLATVREQELRDAAAILGITDVRFLGYRDSGMFGTESNQDPNAFVQQPLERVTRKIADLLEELRPDVIITFSEEGIYLHPDHMYIHDAVVAALPLYSGPPPYLYQTSFAREMFLALSEQEHDPFEGMPEERKARMGQPLEAFTVTVDVEPYVDRKIAAFRAHKTQQPADGEPEFVEDAEQRRQFGQLERYILASSPNGASDPLQLLATELGGG
jgi:N-acetyl-1-D-myo-inositol-2-amino-2-deoxy-alpha-D-glucopyranoside deacetylase